MDQNFYSCNLFLENMIDQNVILYFNSIVTVFIHLAQFSSRIKWTKLKVGEGFSMGIILASFMVWYLDWVRLLNNEQVPVHSSSQTDEVCSSGQILVDSGLLTSGTAWAIALSFRPSLGGELLMTSFMSVSHSRVLPDLVYRYIFILITPNLHFYVVNASLLKTNLASWHSH